MLEILYRIYQIPNEEERQKNLELNRSFGIFSSTSKQENIELLMDCLICESRDEFKSIIRDEYGEDIAFRYSKDLKEGQIYCIIIGEHCYDTEKYFNRVTYKCAYCGSEITTYVRKPISIDDYVIKSRLCNQSEYKTKRFCSSRCRDLYVEREIQRLKAENEDYVDESWLSRYEFNTISENLSGYIYKITKKSTGEFYIGQTVYLPIFRWGQHLRTERFAFHKLTDYQFEVIELVPSSVNLLEREKFWIQKCYMENPKKSLNIAATGELRKNNNSNIEDSK